jgi:hypothetical protein
VPKAIKGSLGTLAALALTVATGGLGSVAFLGLTGFQAVLARVAASFVVSGLSSALSKKKNPAAQAYVSRASGQTLSFRQPITTHKLIYGEVRVSGPLINAGSTSGNKYLHMIIPLAAHECAGIDEVWLDEDVIPNDALDADGMVISGKYAGKVRIRKWLGSDGQTADPFLVAELPGWTTDHRGRGICYLYVRFELDRTLFPNGAPNPSAVVRGRKIFDSRAGMAGWTPNMGLAAYHYLTDERHGIEVGVGDLAQAEAEAASNACEEIVTTQAVDTTVSAVAASTDILTLSGTILLFQRGDRVEVITAGTAPGGLATATDYFAIPYQFKGVPRIKLAATLEDAIAGTGIDITDAGTGTHTIRKTGEPRYFGGGVIDTADRLGSNLRDILSGMAGKGVNTGGLWKLFAGVYRAPAITLSERHLVAPLRVDTRVKIDEKFNTVKGIYVSPLNNWQASDYPMITSSVYVAADLGKRKMTDIDLPMTQRPLTAQRIARIALGEHRQGEIRLPYHTNLHGLQFQPCSTFNIDNARMGWSSKPFEVDSWKLGVDDSGGAPVLRTEMVVRSTSASVYSWTSDDDILVGASPPTNLPDSGAVSAVVGLAVDSIAVETQDGDNVFRVIATWMAHEDAFVRERGKILVRYKLSSSAVWLDLPPLDGRATRADIFTAALGTLYDLEFTAVNSRGVPSAPNVLPGLSVGSGGGVGATLDYESVADSPATFLDYGSVADVPTTFYDYGGII